MVRRGRLNLCLHGRLHRPADIEPAGAAHPPRPGHFGYPNQPAGGLCVRHFLQHSRRAHRPACRPAQPPGDHFRRRLSVEPDDCRVRAGQELHRPVRGPGGRRRRRSGAFASRLFDHGGLLSAAAAGPGHRRLRHGPLPWRGTSHDRRQRRRSAGQRSRADGFAADRHRLSLAIDLLCGRLAGLSRAVGHGHRARTQAARVFGRRQQSGGHSPCRHAQ